MSPNKILLKTTRQIEKMAENGKYLADIKKNLHEKISVGVSAYEIEECAVKLIKKAQGKPSFKMVKGYSWATCVNVNETIVHGIPHKDMVFKKGDIVSVDIGLFKYGFHTDTSFSVGLSLTKENERFLQTGLDALSGAIQKIIAGNKIYDISQKIQAIIEENHYTPIKSLVGHGIGKALHEPPQIPCFTESARSSSPDISEGAVFAIEVMYTKGSPNLKVSQDGWTITTRDDKISALFEETVAVTASGPVILTEVQKKPLVINKDYV